MKLLRINQRILLAAIVVTAVLACQGNEHCNGVTAEVLEFGTFELAGEPRKAQFTTLGDVVTPKLGLGLGFRFKLDNVPSDSIELKTFVTHPPITEGGKTTTRYAVLTTIPVENGSVVSVTGHTFDRPAEMTPGVWTFRHVYCGKTLVEQSLTVRAS